MGLFHDHTKYVNGELFYESPTHNSWKKLRVKCKEYKRWKNFKFFLDDMGVRPKDGHVLSRKNLRKPHGPGNTIWTTMSMVNQRRRKGNGSTLPKGVYKVGERFKAAIFRDGKYKHLGMFGNSISAGLVYDEAAKKYYGKDAWLNINGAY